MKIIATHPEFPAHMVRRAVAWIAGEIGLRRRQRLTITIGYRQRAKDGWQGWYRHGSRSVEVWIGRNQTFPVRIGRNRQEAGRTAADVIELFVRVLAHELEHARAYQTASRGSTTGRRLNSEPRVRSIDYRVLLAFRQRRDELLAEWMVAPAVTTSPARLQPTAGERRAHRAGELLAAWERRLRLAKTKVAKYRRRVAYYARAATASAG
jgi:hypothetical protein